MLPRHSSIAITRAWLDQHGYHGMFQGWFGDALLGQSDAFICSNFAEDDQQRAQMLIELLTSARQCPAVLTISSAPSCPSAPSDRAPFAVFVLVLRDSTGKLQLLGTAFAVDTPSKTIAMTSAHCIWVKDKAGRECRRAGDILMVSRVERPIGTVELSIAQDEGCLCYHMKPIYHNTLGICLLQIDSSSALTTHPVFQDTLKICESHAMPRSARDLCEVKVMQVPMALFATWDLPSLEITVSEWIAATLLQEHYFFACVKDASGSSGGPAINRRGEAVGMTMGGYAPPIDVELLPFESAIDAAVQWSGEVIGGEAANYVKLVKVDGHEQQQAYRELLASL